MQPIIADKLPTRKDFLRQIWGLTFLVILIVSGVLFGINDKQRVVSPITNQSEDGTDITFKLAQFDKNGTRLQNTLASTPEIPCYERIAQSCPISVDSPLALTRPANGPIDASSFSRIQGEFTYTSPVTGDTWEPVSSSGLGSQPGHFTAFSSWKNKLQQICFGTWRYHELPQNPNNLPGGSTICKPDGQFNLTTFNASNGQAQYSQMYTGGGVYQGQNISNWASWTGLDTGIPVLTGVTGVSSNIGGNFYEVGPPSLYSQTKGPGRWSEQRIMSSVVFNDQLYVSTWSQPDGNVASLGAQIWRHQGDLLQQTVTRNFTWQKVIDRGLNIRSNEGLMHLFVYNDKIFASVLNKTTGAKLFYSSNGSNWQSLNIPETNNGGYVTSSAIFQNKIFINVYRGGIYSSSDGLTWNSVASEGGRAMTVAGGKLFFSADKNIYKSEDGETFTLSSQLPLVLADEIWTLNTVGNKVLAGTGAWNNANYYGGLSRNARVWCLGCGAPGEPRETSLTFNLPPAKIYRPDKIEFDGSVFQVSYSPSLSIGLVSGSSNYTAEIIEVDSSTLTTDPIGKYYHLKIKNFLPRSNPYQFKMTFLTNVPSNNIAELSQYLNQFGPLRNSFFDGDECYLPQGSDYLCLRTSATVKVPEITSREVELNMLQKVGIPGITVEGNVAGPGTLKDFTIEPNSIVVGGTVLSEGGTALSGYINSSRKIAWNNVSQQLTDRYDTGQRIGTDIVSSKYSNGTGEYSGNRWELNAFNRDPLVTTVNSISSPPEGKIWKTHGNLALTVPINFSGSGTIVVGGNLTIKSALTCDSQARLAFIVAGSISVETNLISCGAFIALGGDLTFSNATSGSVKGIFIARGDVNLPKKTLLTGPYAIKYDSYLAAHPTALLTESLEILFTTSS